MKTFKNLYSEIYSFDRLYDSYIKARRGKRNNRDVLAFESNLEGNLIQLQNELMWDMYTTGPYRMFYVLEPKRRLVAALPFRDRVVQHSLISVLEPIFERRFIEHSYACRVGKGMHSGANKAQSWIKTTRAKHGKVYCLKADVSKYFASISQDILISIISRVIKCERTIELIKEILGSWLHGLPIGSLISQLGANIYLNELDQYIKNDLRVKLYIRYMDDFVIIHHNKQHLHELLKKIELWLKVNLDLKLNKKTQIFPVAKKNGRGLDFLGYVIWDDHKRLRKDSVKRMRRRLKIMVKRYSEGRISLQQIQNRIASWQGHASHADSYRIRDKLLSDAVFIKGNDHV